MSTGVARIFQQGVGQSEGAKRPRGGGRVWEGGVPPPTVGRFLKFRVAKWHFCTLNVIIRG